MTIEKAQKLFKQCQEHESDNRKRALDDIKFARMSEQWDEKAKLARDKDGRPYLTLNRLPTFLRQVVNDARQNKPQIKVKPVDDSGDPKTAEIINGIIRNIEYCSDAGAAYDTAIEHAVSGGFGYFRIDLEYAFDDSFELDIRINRIPNQFSVYGDPNSEAVDSSDWDVAFVVTKLTKEQFETQYPKAEKVNWEHDFKDLEEWFDGDSVVVAEFWERKEVPKTVYLLSNGQTVDESVFEQVDGVSRFDVLMAQGVTIVDQRETKTRKVTQTLMTGAEVLEEHEWPGKFIPIVPVYGDEINIEGKREFKSLIHDAKDAQMMFNYWRTTTTEMVAQAPKAPYIGPKGAFDADDGWDKANTESLPYLEYDGAVPPQRQPFAGIPAGALQEALNSSDDMKSIMGLYDAALGAQSNETSGKAILARQKEGDVSTFHFIDNLSRAIRHAGKIIIDLIPKVYNSPRIMRIIGLDENTQNVPVNQPLQDGGVFDLTAGKYDLTVSVGPSFSTQREEAANQMLELIRVYPNAAPVIGDLLAKSMDWYGADEVAERLKATLPPNIQGGAVQAVQQQAQQQIQQIQQQMGQIQGQLNQVQQENQALKMQLKDKSVATQIDAEKVQIERFKAETDRLKLQTEANKPQVVEDRSFDHQVDSQRLEIEWYKAQTDRMETEAKVVQLNPPKPKAVQKVVQAIKQPNGTYLIESQADDGTVKRAEAAVENGNIYMKSIEENLDGNLHQN